ncbi:mitochondrial import receptor subunit TOM20 homolog [Gasterosteus aculeatus]
MRDTLRMVEKPPPPLSSEPPLRALTEERHADEDQLALRSDLTTVHRVTTSCEDLSLFVLQLPDLKDAEAVQKFFLEEIQLGEELLAQGDYEKGVDHLTNAIAVCGQPQQLLQVLQQTLPPPVFQMLLTKLPSISQRIVSAQSLSEDDIE